MIRPVGMRAQKLKRSSSFRDDALTLPGGHRGLVVRAISLPGAVPLDQCLTPWTHSSPSHSSSSSIGIWPLKTVPKADRAGQFTTERVSAVCQTTTTGLLTERKRQELPMGAEALLDELGCERLVP